MDPADKRLIEQLTKRLDALTAQFRESQRPKPTTWIQNAAPLVEVFKFTLTEDMTAGGHADIFTLSGTAFATDVVVEDTLNDFTHLKDGEDGLCIRSAGAYYAIHPEAAAAKALVAFELVTDLSATSGTGTVTFTTSTDIVATGASITLLNPIGELAYTGAIGTAIKIGNSWYVIEVNRPEAWLQVTFDCNSHDWTSGDSPRGFNADQTTTLTVSSTTTLSSYPVNDLGSITISNPYNLNWITGDRALLRKQDNNDYLVVKVLHAVCLRFRFKLSANAPDGLTPTLTATAICPTNSDSGPPPSGTISIQDIYGLAHNAKTNHKGIAEYDYNNGWWYVTECEHNALRFRGTLNGSLSGGASFFSVNPVVAFNGKLPSGPLNVHNMHSWDEGTNGYIVSCEWNPVDGRYEAYQMRCPN